MVEKTGNVKAKTNLQPPFYVKEINSKYPKSYCPLIKKDKKNTYWKPYNEASNKNKDKAKSHNPFSTNQSQT